MNETVVNEIALNDRLNRRNGAVALALGASGAIASLLVLPYALAMTQKAWPPIGGILVTFGANFVVIALLAYIGLRAGQRFGLDSPAIRRWLAGASAPPSSRWILAIVVGIVAAVAAGLLQAMLPLPADSIDVSHIPASWKGLLASFYGGIVEETAFRLFLVSVIVWLATRVLPPRPAVYWTAIVIAAILFGAAHLPNWSAVSEVPLNPAIVISIISANAVCGIAFGWLFCRYGIEHAIAAHFSTDIVLHVLLPLVTPHG